MSMRKKMTEYGNENEEPICVSVENTGNPEIPLPNDDCEVVKALRKVRLHETRDV